MISFEIEKVAHGVWVHTKNPDTGERVSVYVNVCGSPDGVIVDFWRGATPPKEDECIHTVGLEWSDFTECEL